MIIKSLSRKANPSQLLKYIFRYMLDPEKQIGRDLSEMKKGSPVFMIRHNIRSRSSINNLIKEFAENESYRLVRRKDSVLLHHVVISFSDKDSHLINDKLLKDVAKKFISERGTNNLYVGTKHEDRDHIHLHIAVSGVQLNGRSSRMSKQQFEHIKLQMDRFQKEKYPELKHSLPKHGKGKERQTKEAVRESAKQSRQTHKEELCNILRETYQKSISKEDFISQLTNDGHKIYYRNGKLQGLVFAGKKFRLNRLGYDDQTIQTLVQKRLEESKALFELQKLREKEEQQLEPRQVDSGLDAEVSALETINGEGKQMLNELSVIRESGGERELEGEMNERSVYGELGPYMRNREDSQMGQDIEER